MHDAAIVLLLALIAERIPCLLYNRKNTAFPFPVIEKRKTV